jgi:uncharacterized YigZ family protein
MSDRFYTVARDARVKIPVGACRFIASVARIGSEEEARERIAQISAEYHDATHNAWAYKSGAGDDAVSRCSDAAEPAGTAGPPMLQAIEQAGLTHVLVVGTRYFGGVKLGIGGLVRAYRACAEAGLAAAGVIEEIRMTDVTCRVPYDLLGAVMREFPAAGGSVLDVDYQGDGVLVRGSIPVWEYSGFSGKIRDATRGKVSPQTGHTNG